MTQVTCDMAMRAVAGERGVAIAGGAFAERDGHGYSAFRLRSLHSQSVRFGGTLPMGRAGFESETDGVWSCRGAGPARSGCL